MDKDLTDTREDNGRPEVHSHHSKRKLGAGEIIFDLGVYGGISWILNEIVSARITNTIYKADPKAGIAKTGMFHETFKKSVNGLTEHVNPMKWSRTPFYLALEMFVMTIGGNLMVLLTKPAEDRKGKIVRWIDNQLSHGKGDADPGIKRAHEEMDEAPKQTWGSQIKGRLLVLASAIGLHFIAGTESKHYQAPTTRWLKNTPFEKYSNLKRIMTTGTRDILSLKFIPFIDKEHKAAMKLNRAAAGEFRWMQENEGKIAMAMGNTFGYVLSVSAAMAALFFASSRFFALWRDEKKEKKEIKIEQRALAHATGRSSTDEAPDAPARNDDKPRAQVAQVDTHVMLSQQQLAVSQGVA